MKRLISRPASLIMVAVLLALLVTGCSHTGMSSGDGAGAKETAAGKQETVSAPLAAGIKEYIVQDGDTLSSIAQAYNIDVDSLYGANSGLTTEIRAGDKVVILPVKGVLHTVDMGETLWSLANLYNVDVAVIMSANGKATVDLAIGEKLLVPGAKLPEAKAARAEWSVSRGTSQRFVWPADGDLTSYYGYRWGRLHAGIDIANYIGTPVRAAMSGRVIYAGWQGGYGWTLAIEHNNGYSTLYGHLSDFNVGEGQYVKAGQVVGYMGNSGYSTGPHLHFEVHSGGRTIDPLSVLP